MTPTAAILIIGDEILSGKADEQNARHLVLELRALGVALRRILVVPDVVDEIAAAVRELSARYDHVFTSGGVGPTHDDLTMEGVARAFATRVVRHPILERMLRDYFGARLAERDLRMADVPDGCELHAPAPSSGRDVWPVVGMGNVYVLPGVPEVFRRKFAAIRERFRAAPFHLACVYTSDEEGRIAGHLDAVQAAFADVALGSYPRFLAPSELAGGPAREGAPRWRVKLTLESKERERVEAAVAELVRRLGPSVVEVE